MPPESQACACGTVGSGKLVRTHTRVDHLDLGFSSALPFTDLIDPA